jgi:hypothetical protein
LELRDKKYRLLICPDNLGKSVLAIDSSESEWSLQYSGDREMIILHFQSSNFFNALLFDEKFFHFTSNSRFLILNNTGLLG